MSWLKKSIIETILRNCTPICQQITVSICSCITLQIWLCYCYHKWPKPGFRPKSFATAFEEETKGQLVTLPRASSLLTTQIESTLKAALGICPPWEHRRGAEIQGSGVGSTERWAPGKSEKGGSTPSVWDWVRYPKFVFALRCTSP